MPLWNRKHVQHRPRKNFEAQLEQLRQQQMSCPSSWEECRFSWKKTQNCVKTSERLRIKLKNSSRNTAAGRPCLNSLAQQMEQVSRFAQSLTLAHLVNLANRHLQKLSDRYQLQKRQGACVEMDIVDRYQADAVRSLESLSGGETFLVSLALALGLSDLARRNHPIDSLFIDEGFGTLDADTLDTALAALETLQAGGKTIGIISHVEALKERLTTQIQVRKNDSGNSTLAVIPNVG